MIPGGFHHGSYIGFPIRLEPPGIVVVGLWCIPSVKGFVHHIHSQPITHIQRDLGCGVMGHADSVEPVFLQNPNPPFFRVRVLTGAKDTVVMVDASTAEKHLLSIDCQAGLCAPAELSYPEGDRPFVRIGFHQNTV